MPLPRRRIGIFGVGKTEQTRNVHFVTQIEVNGTKDRSKGDTDGTKVSTMIKAPQMAHGDSH